MWAAGSSTAQCFCAALRTVLSSLTCVILTLLNTGWEPLEVPLEKMQIQGRRILSNVSLSLENFCVSPVLHFHPSSFFSLAQHAIFSSFSLGIYSWDFPAHLFPLPGVPDSSSNYVISILPFHGFFQAVGFQKLSRKERVLAADFKELGILLCLLESESSAGTKWNVYNSQW